MNRRRITRRRVPEDIETAIEYNPRTEELMNEIRDEFLRRQGRLPCNPNSEQLHIPLSNDVDRVLSDDNPIPMAQRFLHRMTEAMSFNPEELNYVMKILSESYECAKSLAADRENDARGIEDMLSRLENAMKADEQLMNQWQISKTEVERQHGTPTPP